MIPCCLTDLKFRIDIPEADIVQITVTGTSIGMGPPTKISRQRLSTVQSENIDNDLIFFMDNIDIDKKTTDNMGDNLSEKVHYHVSYFGNLNSLNFLNISIC